MHGGCDDDGRAARAGNLVHVANVYRTFTCRHIGGNGSGRSWVPKPRAVTHDARVTLGSGGGCMSPQRDVEPGPTCGDRSATDQQSVSAESTGLEARELRHELRNALTAAMGY